MLLPLLQKEEKEMLQVAGNAAKETLRLAMTQTSQEPLCGAAWEKVVLSMCGVDDNCVMSREKSCGDDAPSTTVEGAFTEWPPAVSCTSSHHDDCTRTSRTYYGWQFFLSRTSMCTSASAMSGTRRE